MGALADPQYERYCLERAAFKTKQEAYKLAGYVPHRGNANRLDVRAEIKVRIAELIEENRRALGLRPEAILARLDRVGDANLADFYEEDGVTLKNITKLPREVTAALAGLEWTEDGRPKIKLHDAAQVNLALLKYLGMVPDPQEGNRSQTNIFNILNVDDQRALAEALEALPRGPATIGGPAPGERGTGGAAP